MNLLKISRVAAGLIAAAAVLIAVAMFGLTSTADAHDTKKVIVREIGVSNFDDGTQCNHEETGEIPESIFGNEYTPGLDIYFTGALEGCIYTYVDLDTPSCTQKADGTWLYYEEGNEFFIGTYSDNEEVDGEMGTLKTRYWFEATFEEESGCTDFIGQIDGGCSHIFLNGSGTGVFKGARGEYWVIDNVVDGVAINLPYIMNLVLRK